MRTVNPLALGLLHKTYRFRGQDRLVVAALGFFRLGASAERFLPGYLQWPQVVPLLAAEQPFNEMMPKARGEVLMAASAHAPAGVPVATMQVRLQLGSVDKTLQVTGERQWLYGLYPLYQVSDPEPFVTMPLGYERAYGGPRSKRNPVGRGYTGNRFAAFAGANRGAMPNVEYAGEPARSNWDERRPAGFGPLDLRWAPRSELHGTYGARWLKEEFPGIAADTDWALFNAAPEDQRIEGYFSGGERYRLEGVHPRRPVIEGELPRLRARAFMLRKGRAPQDAEEVPLVLETIWLFPERELGLALYRGQADIADSDALDIAALIAGYERCADAPRPAAHYREVLGLRLDPATAALHAMHESQLAPERTAAERELRMQRRLRAESAQLAKRQAILDETDAEFWEKSGFVPPAGHAPPKAQPPLRGAPIPEEIEEGDVELSELMRSAEVAADEVRKRGEAQMRALQAQAAPAAPAPDPVQQKKEALARAAAPAPAQAQAAALRRQSRRAAPEPTMPPEPLLAEVAAALGAQALAWHRAGVALAGRDLAGASLRGMDFSGADLREAMLERADLTGAKLAGANLSGAVLSGAILDGADFSGAQLAQANFSRSRGAGIRFTGATLAEAQAIEAAWPRAQLEGAVLDGLVGMKIDLSGAVLDKAQLSMAVLLQAHAPGSRWRGARLEKTVLYAANLEAADFAGASLERSVLMDAALRGSDWQGARFVKVQAGGKADWSGAALRGASASQCGWRGAALAGADLSGGKFVQCDFGEADFTGADLTATLLARSILISARFIGCRAQRLDLFQARARKADFSRADMLGANLVQADMFEARV